MVATWSGFRVFTLIWAGQLVSMLGTGMTRFALMVWAYQQTGAATTLALMGFFAWLPYALVSPVAGMVVDRLGRRQVLLLADTGSASATLLVLVLYWSSGLSLWHLYLLEALTSVFDAFQAPAYIAATSTLLTKSEYARANGMRSLALDTSRIVAPMAGGALLPLVDISGIMLVDLATFLVALATLLPVRIPACMDDDAENWDGTFMRRLGFGLRYIRARTGLLGLMLMFTGVEFFASLTYFSILPALILARTGGNEIALGLVMATLGGAGVLGGILVSIWGLPKKKIHAVLGYTAISFLCGDFLFGVGHTLPVWIVAGFVAAVVIPYISSAYTTIWQHKVPPAIQGRIFATRGMFQNGIKPVAYLIAGPMADWWLEPMLRSNSELADNVGWLVGTGPGAGIGLMFVGTAIGGATLCACGYLIRPVRCIEQELPDYDA